MLNILKMLQKRVLTHQLVVLAFTLVIWLLATLSNAGELLYFVLGILSIFIFPLIALVDPFAAVSGNSRWIKLLPWSRKKIFFFNALNNISRLGVGFLNGFIFASLIIFISARSLLEKPEGIKLGNLFKELLSAFWNVPLVYDFLFLSVLYALIFTIFSKYRLEKMKLANEHKIIIRGYKHRLKYFLIALIPLVIVNQYFSYVVTPIILIPLISASIISFSIYFTSIELNSKMVKFLKHRYIIPTFALILFVLGYSSSMIKLSDKNLSTNRFMDHLSALGVLTWNLEAKIQQILEKDLTKQQMRDIKELVFHLKHETTMLSGSGKKVTLSRYGNVSHFHSIPLDFEKVYSSKSCYNRVIESLSFFDVTKLNTKQVLEFTAHWNRLERAPQYTDSKNKKCKDKRKVNEIFSAFAARKFSINEIITLLTSITPTHQYLGLKLARYNRSEEIFNFLKANIYDLNRGLGPSILLTFSVYLGRKIDGSELNQESIQNFKFNNINCEDIRKIPVDKINADNIDLFNSCIRSLKTHNRKYCHGLYSALGWMEVPLKKRQRRVLNKCLYRKLKKSIKGTQK